MPDDRTRLQLPDNQLVENANRTDPIISPRSDAINSFDPFAKITKTNHSSKKAKNNVPHSSTNNSRDDTVSSPNLSNFSLSRDLFDTTIAIDKMNTENKNINRLVDKTHKFNGKNVDEFIEDLEFAKNYLNSDEEKRFVQAVVHYNVNSRDIKFDYKNFETITQLINEVRSYASSGVAGYESLWGQLEYVQQDPSDTVQDFASKIQGFVKKIKELKLEENPPTAEFDRFSERLNKHAIDNFKHGLKKEIRYELGNYENFHDLVFDARRIEGLQERRYNYRREPNKSGNVEKFISRAVLCQICKKPNHEGLACTDSPCIYCKNDNHVSHDCRKAINKIMLIYRWCSKTVI